MYTASQRAYSLYSTINKITEKLTREDLNLHAHLKLLVSEEQPYNYLFASNIHLASLNCFVNSLVVRNYYCFLVILWLDVTMLQTAMLSFLFDRIVAVLSQCLSKIRQFFCLAVSYSSFHSDQHLLWWVALIDIHESGHLKAQRSNTLSWQP